MWGGGGRRGAVHLAYTMCMGVFVVAVSCSGVSGTLQMLCCSLWQLCWSVLQVCIIICADYVCT